MVNLSDVITVNRHEYKISKLLGSGGFSEVYLVNRLSDEKNFILKYINAKTLKNVNNTICEIKLLQLITKEYNLEESCNLNRLVDFNRIRHSRFNSEFNLILEYIPGVELYEFIVNKLSRDFDDVVKYRIIRSICIDILRGLSILHSLDISHRDLKTENVMIVQSNNNFRAVIIDFNLSCTINNDFLMLQDSDPVYEGDLIIDSNRCHCNLVGTRQYVSVELITNGVSNFSDLKASDVWSFGVILYLMLFGRFPFNTMENWQSLINYNYYYSSWQTRLRNNFTPFNGFISEIFVDKSKRPNCGQLLEKFVNLKL